MAGESNQVNWRGIRPTDPEENIPVKLMHVNAIVTETVKDTNTVAGNVTLNTSAVPSGEIHCISSICAFNIVTSNSAINIFVFNPSASYNLRRKVTPAIGEEILVQTPIYLTAGCYIKAIFSTCVAGDNIQLHIVGYKLQQ